MEAGKKYVLITGGTSGIGYELARCFAQDGYNLVIIARHQDGLDKAASDFKQQYGVDVVTISKDLFNRQAPFEVYEEVKNKGITIDILVNDAGQGEYGEFVENDINRELDIIQLNIGAYVTFTKLYLKEMVARNEGRILNVGSVAGKMPGPLQAVYHATKAFVLSFDEAVQSEIKDTNVTITTLMPGVTDTDFFRKADMEDSKMVQGDIADPAKVARDGYDALMSGERRIVSGFKNKAMVAMSNMMPDSAVAENMHKQMEPVKDENKNKQDGQA